MCEIHAYHYHTILAQPKGVLVCPLRSTCTTVVRTSYGDWLDSHKEKSLVHVQLVVILQD
jgi:hypothetical protein